jgi:hypothetical protein
MAVLALLMLSPQEFLTKPAVAVVVVQAQAAMA